MNRRAIIRAILLGTAGITAFAAKGFSEPGRLEVTRKRILNTNLRRNLTIVQVTDTHLTYTGDDEDIPHIVNGLQPDMVLFTGDYVDHGTGTPPVIDRFQQYIQLYNPDTPMFAIFGNWDRGYEERLFKGTPVRTLRNARESVRIGETLISITGLDYFNPDIRLLETADPRAGFHCVLYHSPDMADRAAATGNYDLMLAGHTHGGQVRMPFLRLVQDGHGSFPWPGAIITMSKTGTKYQSGLYQLQKMMLYVSRGLGESDGIPFRFLCKPELAVIEIGPE